MPTSWTINKLIRLVSEFVLLFLIAFLVDRFVGPIEQTLLTVFVESDKRLVSIFVQVIFLAARVGA